jgi:hypothetical protein
MTIRRPLQLAICCAAFALSRGAVAQSDMAIGYQGLPARSPKGAGGGAQVSDSVMLHAGIGVEAGYDSNVFYGDKGYAVSSPIIRVLPFVEITNAGRSGVAPSGVFFDLDLNAGYRRYLSSEPQPQSPNKKISDQSEFLPSANGLLEFSSGQTLSVMVSDIFSRFEDAPYITSTGRTGPLIRYVNSSSAALRYAPGGGRLQSAVRYDNTYDAFSSDSGLSFANSIAHQFTLDVSWKWLPKTAIFVSASQGYVTYLNDQSAQTGDTRKATSYPFHSAIGLRGLVTQKTSVNLWVGYSNAIYVSGPNPEGLQGHINANAEVSVRPTVLTTLGANYRHDFQNAVIGNFYYVDGGTVWLQQMIGSRVSAGLSGRYEHRIFQFISARRTDNFLQLGAVVDFHPKPWGYIGVAYSSVINDSAAPEASGMPGPAAPPGANYVKHQIFGRIGVTY